MEIFVIPEFLYEQKLWNKVNVSFLNTEKSQNYVDSNIKSNDKCPIRKSDIKMTLIYV